MKTSKNKEDGCWYGWIVVLGSIYIQSVVVGGAAASGMFLRIFSNYFQKSTGRTFAVQSLSALMGLIVGENNCTY